jgi:ribosomal protein L12E/L44/L45/RPP1/RPP2
MKNSRSCPPFGAGSVDFSAVHAADAAGKDLTKAIEAAKSRSAAPATAPAASAESKAKPAPKPDATPPST